VNIKPVAAFQTSQSHEARPKTPFPATRKKEMINNTKIRGIDILRDPKLNKVNSVMIYCTKNDVLYMYKTTLLVFIDDSNTKVYFQDASFLKHITEAYK